MRSLPGAEFNRDRGAGNQRALRRLIATGARPGLGGRRLADTFAWFGLATAFRRAGFVEVARRSRTRPIMRFVVGAKPKAAERRAARSARG